MEEKNTQVELLVEKTERFTKTSLELFRLKAIDKSTDVISLATAIILATCFFLLFFPFASIGLALWVGDLLGKNSYGFFAVALFYGLIGLILFLFRKKIIVSPLKNILINLFDKK